MTQKICSFKLKFFWGTWPQKKCNYNCAEHHVRCVWIRKKAQTGFVELFSTKCTPVPVQIEMQNSTHLMEEHNCEESHEAEHLHHGWVGVLLDFRSRLYILFRVDASATIFVQNIRCPHFYAAALASAILGLKCHEIIFIKINAFILRDWSSGRCLSVENTEVRIYLVTLVIDYITIFIQIIFHDFDYFLVHG